MKTLKLRTRSTAKRAFTLIEIMVATVIMIVLVGLVIQITSEVLKVWTRSSGKLSANAQARIAMDLITQDLETAVFRNNGQQWLRVEAPLEDDYNEKVNLNAADDQTVGLKLFSPALDREEGPGDICAIAYRLAYRNTYGSSAADATKVFALYRMIVDPEETFTAYMGSSSDSTSPQESLTSALWDDGLIVSDENYLVSNIVEFKVLVYELDVTEDGSGTSTKTAELMNADVATGELKADYAYGGDLALAEVSTNQLLYADIILTVVSDEGLELLRLLDQNQGGTGYATAADVVLKHGETFTRRVNFMAHPL